MLENRRFPNLSSELEQTVVELDPPLGETKILLIMKKKPIYKLALDTFDLDPFVIGAPKGGKKILGDRQIPQSINWKSKTLITLL